MMVRVRSYSVTRRSLVNVGVNSNDTIGIRNTLFPGRARKLFNVNHIVRCENTKSGLGISANL
jgi:hypothetical protein